MFLLLLVSVGVWAALSVSAGRCHNSCVIRNTGRDHSGQFDSSHGISAGRKRHSPLDMGFIAQNHCAAGRQHRSSLGMGFIVRNRCAAGCGPLAPLDTCPPKPSSGRRRVESIARNRLAAGRQRRSSLDMGSIARNRLAAGIAVVLAQARPARIAVPPAWKTYSSQPSCSARRTAWVRLATFSLR
jgi:hypothetical protein